MKILYSHRTRAADGQRVHIRALQHAFAARGHKVEMVEPRGARGIMLDARAPGLLRRLAPPVVHEAGEVAYAIGAYRRLHAAAARFQPDILYQRHNLYFDAGARLRRASGLAFLLEVNAPLAEERAGDGRGLAFPKMARLAEASLWRAADQVLAVSTALAEKVRAAGVAQDKIAVIPNGVDAAFLAPCDGAAMRARFGLEEKCVLGFAGFVRDWHGLSRVIDFMRRASREDLHLLVVGDGPARAGLERLAREAGLQERISFTGVVQRDAMPKMIAAFDIALAPAAPDYASPLKIFEYMALGKAILAPDQPNIREILCSGNDALLFGSSEADDFDRALNALIDDAQLRDRLGAGARETLIRRDFTWDGAARRIEALAAPLIARG